MQEQNNNKFSVRTIVFIGMLSALVYAATLLRVPFLGSKVHFANAICLLAGMLLGPVPGGLAAGIGSALYDTFTGYDIFGILITFVSKFAMAWVCGMLMRIPLGEAGKKTAPLRTLLAAVAGALIYVFLYMLKTFIYQRFVYGFPLDATMVTVWSKFVPSIINAAAAVIVAPILFHAINPALKRMDS